MKFLPWTLLALAISYPLFGQGTLTYERIICLTPEQEEIFSHMSIVFLDDGQGGMAKTIRFTGVNVQVVNGLESTNGFPFDPDSVDPLDTVVNGVGNLVVGYNELGNPLFGDDRTGSHNIVVGHGNNYTSFGGFVGPHDNMTSAPFASVTGGKNNRASRAFSSVSGGATNWAVGTASSVSGGRHNTASGVNSSVSGGWNNGAITSFSSVSGGRANIASGNSASMSGGRFNTASGDYSSVSGGQSSLKRARPPSACAAAYCSRDENGVFESVNLPDWLRIRTLPKEGTSTISTPFSVLQIGVVASSTQIAI